MNIEQEITNLYGKTTRMQQAHIKDKADLQKDINVLYTNQEKHHAELKDEILKLKDKVNRNQDDIDDIARGTDLALKETESLKDREIKPIWKFW